MSNQNKLIQSACNSGTRVLAKEPKQFYQKPGNWIIHTQLSIWYRCACKQNKLEKFRKKINRFFLLEKCINSSHICQLWLVKWSREKTYVLPARRYDNYCENIATLKIIQILLVSTYFLWKTKIQNYRRIRFPHDNSRIFTGLEGTKTSANLSMHTYTTVKLTTLFKWLQKSPTAYAKISQHKTKLS